MLNQISNWRMHKIKHFAVASILTTMLVVPAYAAEPVGNWLVANGHARVRIAPCGDAYWGIIDWSSRPGDIDKYNPDPAKRGRPVLGIPILIAMKPAGANEWSGHVYNAQNGRTYEATISLAGPDELKITGCVLGGLFCGGESWTRVKDDDFSSANPAAPSTNRAQTNRARSKNAPPRQNDRAFCPEQSEVRSPRASLALARPPHESGLK